LNTNRNEIDSSLTHPEFADRFRKKRGKELSLLLRRRESKLFIDTIYREIVKRDLTSLDTDYTVVSTTNSLNFSESGWWGRILSGNESIDPNFDRFVGCGRKGNCGYGYNQHLFSRRQRQGDAQSGRSCASSP
jgi:hypothetical protein